MITARSEREASDARSPKPEKLERAAQVPAAEAEGARRELVRRVVQSPTFARSERLGTLLTYVCNQALKGREAEINEQKIGHAVFGRSEDYDSAVDGIVRSQASRLRQRLELYFQQEGAAEPVRIVIPRGRYVPVFEPNSAFASTPAAVLAETAGESAASASLTASASSGAIASSATESDESRKSLAWRWLQWALSPVLAIMLVVLWVHDRRAQTATAVPVPTHPFWSHLFAKDRPAMVVAPDSGLVLFHVMSGREIDLKGYLDAGYRMASNEASPTALTDAAQKNRLFRVANARYTSMTDVEAILSLKDRAKSLGSDVSVRYARDLRPNDLKAGTVILLGASSANPWVELFEHNMNFVLTDNYAGTIGVRNRNPQKGEPAQWVSVAPDPQHRVFAVIAYLPNLSGDGNALMIEGTTMAGTEAATDFVNDDVRLLPFLSQIRRPDGSLPHFELLLEANNLSASAVRSQILAWRTMN